MQQHAQHYNKMETRNPVKAVKSILFDITLNKTADH